MTVLVTGGAGYIGSHVLLALAKAGKKIVTIDNLSTGRENFIPSGVVKIIGNVGDRALLGRVLKNYDVESIIHLAASIKVGESVLDPMKYYHNNTVVTAVLLQEALRAKVRHFIFSSTAAVYGTPSVVPIGEGVPLKPESPYGRSKLMCETLLQDIEQTNAISFIALRYFNVVGADPVRRCGYNIEQQPSHLVRKALAVAMGREEYLPVYGSDYPTHDGTAIRDYVHVNDVASAHVSALGYIQEGGLSGIYNVGTGRGYSVLEVVAAVEKVTGRKVPTRMEDRRSGDAVNVVADVSRIRKELGWMPQHTELESAIETQFKWELSEEERSRKTAVPAG